MGFLGNLFGPKTVNIERRFKLLHEHGQGSMSRVWRANDNQTGRQVCVKVLDKQKLDQLLKRFTGMKRPCEGEIATRLEHPHVVKTFEYGITTNREEFLVMEYLDGVGLGYFIQTRKPEHYPRLLRYLHQIAQALDYVHQQGFIHRDICPRNVIVTKEDQAKLIDFGLAVPNTAEFRRPGNRTGTINYMAPELIRRAPTDQRIDVYGFGVLAYEVLCGELPWESAESLQAMLQHINAPPRNPRELNPQINEPTAKLLLRLIEKDPKIRTGSMREVTGELEGLIRASRPPQSPKRS